MALNTELISQLAKVITPKETRPEFTTVTGRAKLYDGKMYVQIDGSNGQLTPIAVSTVGLKDNDWVTVQIKNHSAIVTGNATDPSAGKSYADDINDKVEDISDQITEFEIVVADKVDAEQINAVNGRIDNLVSENATITGKLDAAEADIDKLTADNVTINENLTAQSAQIENLETTKLSADIADLTYATIENLETTNANIHNLEADYGEFKELTTDNFSAANADIENLETTKLSAEQADLKYANIDFTNIGVAAVKELFAKSGIIDDLVVSDQHITGHLVGVTISGDLIEGNTIKADKLVVLGDDGLYYKLNVNAETVGTEQTEYNSLNGSIITANTITAEKINVDDLVAFDATIGGFKIDESSIYSGAKSSIDNTTRGIYMDDTGQLSVGDNSNYLKYFKDTDGTWKLDISAQSIRLGAKSVDAYINEQINSTVSSTLDDIEVGGRNLILNSIDTNATGTEYSETTYPTAVYATSPVGIEADEEYTISLNVTVEGATSPDAWVGVYAKDETLPFFSQSGVTDGTQTITKTITASADQVDNFEKVCVYHNNAAGNTTPTNGMKATVNWIKFERGNKATDWSPAPEDVQEGIDNAMGAANDAQGDADNALGRIDTAEVNIDSLNTTIQNLVVGADGETLMTVDDEGVRFDFASFQQQIANALDGVESVEGDLDIANNVITNLNHQVDELSELKSYIAMGDDSGTPYIELGSQNGSFKVRITNTEMSFMQDTEKIAYISNKQLYIQSSVVTDEMKIGAPSGYIWKKRANSHMGLRWVTS